MNKNNWCIKGVENGGGEKKTFKNQSEFQSLEKKIVTGKGLQYCAAADPP